MKDLKNEELMKGEEVNDVKLMKKMRSNELIENDMVRRYDVKMRGRKQRNTKLLLKKELMKMSKKVFSVLRDVR